jgi:hypothetical protein
MSEYTTKFDTFSEWLTACCDVGFTMNDITEDVNQYTFKIDGNVVAYWDRSINTGFVTQELWDTTEDSRL